MSISAEIVNKGYVKYVKTCYILYTIKSSKSVSNIFLSKIINQGLYWAFTVVAYNFLPNIDSSKPTLRYHLYLFFSVYEPVEVTVPSLKESIFERFFSVSY